MQSVSRSPSHKSNDEAKKSDEIKFTPLSITNLLPSVLRQVSFGRIKMVMESIYQIHRKFRQESYKQPLCAMDEAQSIKSKRILFFFYRISRGFNKICI